MTLPKIMKDGIVGNIAYNHRTNLRKAVIFFMVKSTKRFAIVRETSAASFEDQLNKTLEHLSDQNPKVEFSETGDYMTARIEYEAKVEIPDEPISERGYKFSCEDCPRFEHLLKKDGTVDGRIKYGNCPAAQYGRTLKSSPACDLLYRMIENGEVELCYSK